MNETKPKKMVSRNVAIAVGIICIVLVASLAGAIAYYTSVISGKDNKISSLESQLSNAVNIGQSYELLEDSKVLAINQTITPDNSGTLITSGLGIEYDNFTDLSGYSANYEIGFSALYSGYLAVTVNGSTENPLTVALDYFNLGYTFVYPLQIGINGTYYFPVTGSPIGGAVAGDTGEIVVLWKNPNFSSDQATLTIVYYY